MDIVNMHEAKSSLSRLVDAVESGRETEIVIARNGKPAARLVPITGTPKKKIRFGLATGQFKVPDDINEYEDEIIRMFEDGPLLPEK